MRTMRSGTAERSQKKPLPHPLVRQALRTVELAAIEAWRARHEVTRCPPAFAIATAQAARDPVTVARGSTVLITSLDGCVGWFQRHGYAVERQSDGAFRLEGQRLEPAALIARAARLQATANTSREAARAAILAALTECVVAAKRCPTRRALHRRLLQHRLYVPRDDGIERLIGGLAADGLIAVRAGVGNVRVVTLLTGPYAGRSTAEPEARAALPPSALAA